MDGKPRSIRGRVLNPPGGWISRWSARLLVGSAVVCLGGAQQQSPSPSTAAVQAVVDRYCLACHNERLKTAGLAFTNSAAAPGENPDVWERVVRKLRHRQMPPAGLPRPEERTYDAVVSSLAAALDRVAAAKPNPGRTDTFRRLNRTEYRNAVRDLLAVEVEVSSLLPPDETSHGFDNITVGELSPTLLEKYLSAAQKISRRAIGSPVRSPSGETILLPPDLTQEDHFDGLPFGTRGGSVIRYAFPLDGEYEIHLRLSRDRDERVEGLNEPHTLELMLDGERIRLFTVKPPGRDQPHHLVDQDLKVRIPVKAGPHDLAAAFLKKTSALLETERQPYLAHFNADRHPRVQPALYSISITGPYGASGAGDTPSRRRIFVCYPASPPEEEACAGRILSTLLRRAYRRPVTREDLQVPLKFYSEARAAQGFEAGVETALRAILVNPQFLFRIERDPPGIAPHTAYRLTDVELASRLSFFLWSSLPDDELLDAAIRGELQKPAALQRQVRRMLADARSEALVASFAAQWLYLRNLESTSPDPRLFPDFDDNLRQAFRRETELFFESILREDRSVLDLLRANYAFLNERLAKHYGIPHVYGSHFRRVMLGKDAVRGGLLSQGSILSVTSYATRTSPVIRGKWILTNLLGTPPPPPPPAVPELKEVNFGGKVLSMRERLALHRANSACASCHNLMDPVGFALENYDAVGRWRTEEDGTPIDAAGNLPDGTKFEGASGLQQALLSRPELFVSALTEKLLTYALGRGLEYYDAPAVREIVRHAGQNDFRFSWLIAGIAGSRPFQMRRSQ
jgi:mono/diheme cytochrome c family protein